MSLPQAMSGVLVAVVVFSTWGHAQGANSRITLFEGARLIVGDRDRKSVV